MAGDGDGQPAGKQTTEGAVAAALRLIVRPSAVAGMASSEPEPPPPPLEDVLRDDPYGFDFFQAVRRLECANPDLPPVGYSHRPEQDVVRFGQEVSAAFAPSALRAFEPGDPEKPGGRGRPRLVISFLGLLGPNGPMPLHLTDYVRDRERNHGDAAMARFFDLFNHRIISLFYRAWAASHQTVSYERFYVRGRPGAGGGTGGGGTSYADRWGPHTDRFSAYFASLFGMGMPSLLNRDAVPDVAKLHYAGRLSAQTHPAEGLRAIIEEFFGIDAEIEEFVGRWIEIPHDARCRLGESPDTCTLGTTAVVGSRIWDCQQHFRVRLGPMTLADYRRMLPGGQSLQRLVAWVRNYTGDEYSWDVRLILKAQEVPTITLGQIGQLGWSTWLNSKPVTKEVGDLILKPCA